MILHSETLLVDFKIAWHFKKLWQRSYDINLTGVIKPKLNIELFWLETKQTWYSTLSF